MKLKLIAVAALAIAIIGPPAIASPALEVHIAIERAAPSAPVDLMPQSAAPSIGVHVVVGGKLDPVSPATPAAMVPSSQPRHVAAAELVRDRESIAYHLRL